MLLLEFEELFFDVAEFILQFFLLHLKVIACARQSVLIAQHTIYALDQLVNLLLLIDLVG